MKRRDVFAVALGGSGGTLARAWIIRWPLWHGIDAWAVVGINWLGGIILAVVMALVAKRRLMEPHRLLFGVGFCGGFTTFSTMIAGLVGFAAGQQWGQALMDLLLSLLGLPIVLAVLTPLWPESTVQEEEAAIAEVDREP
ncbi:MAG: CrcB family protein [Firmicutes bacterium]|nr:CrcB family protein [Bacillota bacterium]